MTCESLESLLVDSKISFHRYATSIGRFKAILNYQCSQVGHPPLLLSHVNLHMNLISMFLFLLTLCF